MGVENVIFWLVGISRQVGKPDEAPLSGLKKLFSKARSRIKILSGELPYIVYCNDGLVDVVKQALKRGCAIEIIVGPEAEKRSLEFMASQGISVYVLEQWPTKHFAVVDGKHVRLEERHDPGQQERTQYINYNFKYAEELENKFDALKKQAKDWGLVGGKT